MRQAGINNIKRKAEYNEVEYNKRRKYDCNGGYIVMKKDPVVVPSKKSTRKNKPSDPNDLMKKFFNDSQISGRDSPDNSDDEVDDDVDSGDTEHTKCVNPQCDHRDYTDDELKALKKKPKEPVPEPIKNINDLIELGKKYHCMKNKTYYGLDLMLLCRLVEPLTKLKNMIGMQNVKEHIVDQIVYFLQKFHHKERCHDCYNCIYDLPCSQAMNNDMLHTVITGSPGVGKTELGKILGHVYKALGVLSKGTFNIATRSDLIGKYLGHTAAKTQAFIDKCDGGVMFIDEAYSLGSPENRDSFSKECLDTLNQNMSEKRDFLVIIAGYEKDLEDSFFKANAGLKRRFTFRYDLKAYTPEELMEIFLLKVRKDDWTTCFIDDHEDKKKHDECLDLFKKYKHLMVNQAGDVESLLLNCKILHGRRVIFLDNSHKKVLTLHDVETGFETLIKHRKGSGTNNIQTVYSDKK